MDSFFWSTSGGFSFTYVGFNEKKIKNVSKKLYFAFVNINPSSLRGKSLWEVLPDKIQKTVLCRHVPAANFLLRNNEG